jgi:tetratricopeptide (TPR) repeat protein
VLQEALRINPGSIVARLNVIALLEDVELSEAADAALDEGLAQVRDRGDQHAEADLLVGRSELLVRREKWAEAIPVLEEALTLYQATRNVASEARTRLGIARAHKAKGDFEAATRWVDEGVAFCRSFALYEAEAQFVLERALMAMDKGDLEVARSEIVAADGLYRSLSDRHPAIGKLERLLEAIP